jgi:hypothetical protein
MVWKESPDGAAFYTVSSHTDSLVFCVNLPVRYGNSMEIISQAWHSTLPQEGPIHVFQVALKGRKMRISTNRMERLSSLGFPAGLCAAAITSLSLCLITCYLEVAETITCERKLLRGAWKIRDVENALSSATGSLGIDLG